jgi:hypothetical protein
MLLGHEPLALYEPKREPTLDEFLDGLRQRIQDLYGNVEMHAGHSSMIASVAIECAAECGGLLRLAKSKLPHGQFRGWAKHVAKIEPRTGSNYMRLHKWISTHRQTILEQKPHSLRQCYILAGILPEDESKKRPTDPNDELAKLRRLVRKVCVEAACHRKYQQASELMNALVPVANLIEDVREDLPQEP